MAKAEIRKADIPDFRVSVGNAIQRAASLVGWSLKELAGKVARDPRQVARWIAGVERPHFDALFAVEELRQPLVVALAELAGDQVEIETVVRVRRTA
jgi:transcriptional regulator with XRE-family HTH domain